MTPEDSLALAAADTARRTRADTVKPPLPRSELPADIGYGPGHRWDRAALDASGALNMLELLERVPAITGFRTGWIASPQLATYAGSAGAVRIFFDGIELAPLSPRASPAIDLAEVPLWPLDEVVVEQGAGEVRVYMRSWSVDRTTPFTRTDVYTGTENTNVYRGYFGRRFGRGEALQLAGEQYGTVSNLAGSGDQLALLGRIGIGRGTWSADAFVIRSSRTRGTQTPRLGGNALSALDGRSTVAYLRASGGDVSAGPWAQLVGASQAYDDRGVPEGEPDLSKSVSDWIATGGYSWTRARLSAAARLRAGAERTRVSQSVRASATAGPVAAQIFAEHGARDSVTHVEGSARMNLPGPFRVAATAGLIDDRRESGAAGSRFGRGELGLAIGRLWLSGGVIYRDSTTLPAALVLEQDLIDVDEPAAVGGIFEARGRVWRDVGIDGHFVGWRTDGWYRPQFHGIGRLFLDTRWLSRFPSGNLGILLVAQAEYRSAVPFPRADGAADVAPESLVFSTMLEVRIVDAVLTFQLRNPRPSRYAQVPGFLMPGPVQYYGVRWAFWN